MNGALTGGGGLYTSWEHQLWEKKNYGVGNYSVEKNSFYWEMKPSTLDLGEQGKGDQANIASAPRKEWCYCTMGAKLGFRNNPSQ